VGKEKHFMVTDTETTGIGSNMAVFDLGYVISTRKRIVLERQFLVKEIITSPQLMLSALFNKEWRAMFGGKLFATYIPAIAAQEMELHGWRDIVETMREDMRTYSVDVFAAYNLDFDKRAISKTQHKICDGGRVLEYKPDLLCLWDFACSTVCNSKLYHDIAYQQGADAGWITPANNVRTTAEKVYAFLSGDLNFIESHTALHDAQIETEILHRLLARKKTIPYNNPNLSHPWRRAQQLKGRLL
jgi:hypothetical protein